MICLICNTYHKNLHRHLKCHEITILDYHIKYLNFKIPKCAICNENAKHKIRIKFCVTCAKKSCIDKNTSIKMKKAHKEKRAKIFFYFT